MRRSAFAICLVAVALSVLTNAQAPTARAATSRAGGDETARLPVRRVALYKSGVGYFEHLGKVRGTQAVTIDFNTSQLNDVLSSLTTLDLGNGRISGISYNSEAPLAQRLNDLGLPIGQHASLVQLLDALRGARFEIRSGGRTIVGRLLGIERVTRGKGDQASARDELSLVADSGEMATVELTPAVSIRLLERDSIEQVGAYLGLLGSTRGQERRRMTITDAGSGERDLLVSYISEVPVWKTTYRIVLPSGRDAKPMLQGWAIVDNTIGEDWNGVELSLIAGAPQSFIYPLSQPQYTQRPVVPLPGALLTRPQTHAATLQESVVVSGEAPAQGRRETGVEGGVVGGVRGGIVGGLAAAPPPAAPAARPSAKDAMQPVAQGRDVGDLFEYRLDQPISIRRNQSALVPIVKAEVAAQRVSLWNASLPNGRPLRALWLTNSSALTLDGGSFTVLDDETFAGEGLVEPLKPGEKRLLSYAIDAGVQVDTRGEERRMNRRVTIAHGVITDRSEERSHRSYTIRNNDATPRSVVVEHPRRGGWTLAGGAEPAETAADAYRFLVNVASKQTAELVVEERRPIENQLRVSQMTDQQLELFVRNAADDAALKQALAPLLAKKAEIAAFSAGTMQREQEQQRIGEDQARIRENMKALKGTAEEQALLKRYATQLAQQEDRLDALKRDLADRAAQQARMEDQLNQLIESLSLDVAGF